jgi:hypothetical protein
MKSKMKYPSAIFHGGSGRLRLSGRLRAGDLDIECEEFSSGTERFTVVRGTIGDQPIYRAKVSYDGDRVLFLQTKDGDVGMTVVFSDATRDGYSNMTVIHDGQPAKAFLVEKAVVFDKRDLRAAIVDEAERGSLDLVGRRPVPPITPGELYDVFAGLDDFQRFLRGSASVASQFSEANPVARQMSCWCIALCCVPACGITCLLCM